MQKTTIKLEKSLLISFLFILTAILFNSNVMADDSEEETAEESMFFDDNGLAGNNSNKSHGNESEYQCLGPSQDDLNLYEVLAWWMDGIVQVIIGAVGFAGNFIAIPILLSKRMASIFNRILVCLAAFDNVFIFCSLLEAVRKNFGPLHDVAHVYAFAYFLYQLQSIAIVSSIFTTVVLALERCLAVAKPIEYHNAVQGTNPWKRVTNYIVPVVIFSTLFNIPKCFEIAVMEQPSHEKRFDEETNTTEWLNRTIVGVIPTDLRMDIDYVFFYNNLAKLVITGVIPFVALCFFNFKIYAALRRRRQMMGPAAAAAHAQQLNEDNRQALVLFGIVIIFLACNIPRVVLNFHEVFAIQNFKEALRHNCYSLPLWVLLMGNISQLSMIINSSINFFIYCFMSSVFREVLYETFLKWGQWLGCGKDGKIFRLFGRCCRNSRRGRQSGSGCLNPSMNNNATRASQQLHASRLDISVTNVHQLEVKKNGNGNSDTHVEMRPLIEKETEIPVVVTRDANSAFGANANPKIEVAFPSESSSPANHEVCGRKMEHLIKGSISTTEITYV